MADNAPMAVEANQYNRCNKHGALRHHFFISYRVFCDKTNSEKLAALLDGARKPGGQTFRAYLDKNCLNQGQNWEFGFTVGLMNSKCVLIMISEGTVNSMKSKALRGETDNVLKEHVKSLALMKEKGVVVIPVYMASPGKTKGGRDSYVNLDLDKSLRAFDERNDNPAVVERLMHVRNTLQDVFALPGVHMEPDAIAEKVPRIIQLYFEGKAIHQKKDSRVNKFVAKAKYIFIRTVKHPSASFRLTLFGTVLGFVTTLISLVLLYMPSKSPQHSALKRGIAYGNIAGVIVLIAVCCVYIVDYNAFTAGVYCSQCESILISNGPGEFKLLERSIPSISGYLKECGCNSTQADWNNSPCLSCVCTELYGVCEGRAGLLLVLYACVAFAAFIILAASVMVNTLSSVEGYAVAFQ